MKAERVGNKRANRDHLNYSIVDVKQNTEQSPGKLKTCCLSYFRERPPANVGGKNLQEYNNNMYHSHIHEYAKCTWDVHNIYT